MKDFKRLIIWQKAVEIAIQSFKLVKAFPHDERFGLSSQITRAGVSISSNIAEGSSRTSEKDYCRFLEISLGSTYELETQVLISEALNYGEQDLRKQLLNNLIEEQKMVVSFLSRIKKINVT